MLDLLDWIGRITTALFVIALLAGIYGWSTGIIPAMVRLGNGFAKRKIAIFAKGNQFVSLKDLLVDSKLFKTKNIIQVSSKNDFGRAEQSTLYLVFWPDWQNELTEILQSKKDGDALIVYAPQEFGFIPKGQMSDLSSRRNVMITNFRGRLLNDIVVSMITPSYERYQNRWASCLFETFGGQKIGREGLYCFYNCITSAL